MGRKRAIDQQGILDAAERVVARDGAANLSIDRVAKEAGISKASVLYDFKTKQAVLEAVVERAFARDNAMHGQLEGSLDTHENRAITGRILGARTPISEPFRNAALNLSAALVLDKALRAKMQANQARVIEDVQRTAQSPRGAQLAYLALEGLKLLENLDFHRFSNEERARILRELQWLAAVEPQERPLPGTD
ncbi:TetR/AcrR family transcriptional regulator [Devosia sp. RR2S18]|uniref:TetR/AcrR family transcriptional regulator n=1 Tax=Devosia rhizosphaerae TaxID=3049774 RepID=UPI0025412BE6|nr:TetR/AcrR family transcriptional regulator [Devosia sp. RR2S18]WIJ25846.1 TetR/AcrR family transcriptional regulator [Devosia sp. RR2S18]